MSTAITKEGKHGKLYRFAIEYTADPNSPVYTFNCWAYDAEHALEKLCGDGSEGWEPVRIAYHSEKPKSQWEWQNLN